MYATEWSTGNQNLNTSNSLYLWVYLIVSPLSGHDPKQYVKFPDCDSSRILCKFIWHPFVPLLKLSSEPISWVIVPVWSMINSYSVITRSLRETKKSQKTKGH